MFNRPEGTLHKSKQTHNYLPIRLNNIFLVKKQLDTFFIQAFFAYLHKPITQHYQKGRGVTECHLSF